MIHIFFTYNTFSNLNRQQISKLTKEEKNLTKLVTSKQYESIAENQPMILMPDKDRFIEKSSKLQRKDNLYLKENIRKNIKIVNMPKLSYEASI